MTKDANNLFQRLMTRTENTPLLRPRRLGPCRRAFSAQFGVRGGRNKTVLGQ